MKCMKCGTRISPGQVFCPDCLTDMEKYPVAQDTPVLLPNRPATVVPKRQTSHKKSRKPEERIAGLRRWIVFLVFLLLIALLCLSASMHMIFRLRQQAAPPVTTTGQGYMTGPSPQTDNP